MICFKNPKSSIPALSVNVQHHFSCSAVNKNMSEKSKKQFGVWMDSHHPTVVGKPDAEAEDFNILGHVENAGADFNTSEKNAYNDEKTLQHKFLKKYLPVCKTLKKCI
jgi:hypothetical protein